MDGIGSLEKSCQHPDYWLIEGFHVWRTPNPDRQYGGACEVWAVTESRADDVEHSIGGLHATLRLAMGVIVDRLNR